MHNIIPISNAFLTPGLNKSIKELFSTFNASFISASSCSALADPFTLVRISFASSNLFFWASQRGLSGTKNNSNKKNTEGNKPDPNIHRQPVDMFHASLYQPAIVAFTK